MRLIFTTIKEMKKELILASTIYLLGFIIGVLIKINETSIKYTETTATATDIFINNIQAWIWLLTGILTLGLITLLSLLMNGVVLGTTIKSATYVLSPLDVILRGATHGVVEILAIICIGAVGFQSLRITVDSIRGKEIKVKDELRKMIILSLVSIILLFIAAVIEGYITDLFI